MSLRDTLNQNQGLVAIGTVVIVVLVAAWLLLRGGGATVQDTQAWYYDTVSKQTFQASSLLGSPHDHEGHEAVKMSFLTCGDCNNPKETHFWYEKTVESTSGAGKDLRYSSDGKNWYPLSAPQAQKMMQVDCPNGATPAMCTPDKLEATAGAEKS